MIIRKIKFFFFLFISVSNYKFSNPSLLNTNEVWGYVDSTGVEYALVGRGNGFSVISLANPESPDLVYSDTSARVTARVIARLNLANYRTGFGAYYVNCVKSVSLNCWVGGADSRRNGAAL